MAPSSRFSNLVLIQKKTKTDGSWNPVIAWAEFRQVWVSLQPDRGREVFKGNELTSVVTHTVRGDFLELEGITEEMRIIYNDTHDYGPQGIRSDSLVFDILAVMSNLDGRDDVMIQANLKALRYGQLPPDIPQ